MADSDQAYDIFSDNSKLNQDANGNTGVNFTSGTVEINLRSSSGISTLAHELVHAFQFDTGKISLGREINEYNYPTKNLLYDQGDEVAAFQRDKLFGGQFDVQNESDLPEQYKNIQKGPYDSVNHPYIGKVYTSGKLKVIAKGTRHAFRVNGKTYYRKP